MAGTSATPRSLADFGEPIELIGSEGDVGGRHVVFLISIVSLASRAWLLGWTRRCAQQTASAL